MAVVATAAAAAILLAAPVCMACSCQFMPTEAHFERADLVFVGVAVSRDDVLAGSHMLSTADPVEWTFEVESVQKGAVADVQTVRTSRHEPSCGYTFKIGDRYQVFARQHDGAAWTNLCAGNLHLSGGDEPYLPASPAETATPQPSSTPTTPPTPDPSPRPLDSPSPEPTPSASPDLTPTDDDAELATEPAAAGQAGTAQVVSVGLAGFALVGAGYVAWSRLRSRGV